jgi:AraC-like DNA-binding protein
MARIAALLPDPTDRESLRLCAPPHELFWADSWKDLHRLVRRHPIALALADAHAEPRKDGGLRAFRFTERFPYTPLVIWGELDGRELYRLGKAGCADVVLSHDADDADLLREILEANLVPGLVRDLVLRLEGRVPAPALEVIQYAAESVPNEIQVPALAEAFHMSVSTLERRFESWSLPTPGRVLLWLRVLHGIRWLLEPGRSVESVAAQLGYSSGAAFRRAVTASIGDAEATIRSAQVLELAVDAFVRECTANGAATVEAH